MKSTKTARLVLPFALLFLAVLACNLPGSRPEGETTEALPAAETGTPSSAEPPPTIAHTVFPGEPPGRGTFLTDPSSKALAGERRSNSDSFQVNLYERPFTASEMDYQAHLDIVRAEIDSDPTWIYIAIFVEGVPPDGSEAQYGVEIDADIDGRGDFFIFSGIPPSSDWTTGGVRAYFDANGDVGGLSVLRGDAPSPGLDGYEDVLFDQGAGDDPDAAWSRRHPSNPNVIELAFKRSLIAEDAVFMWGVWADEGPREPGFLDYHDRFTLQEAGSPSISLPEYPLKELHSVDNTCRWGFGFEPVGNEPGVCFIPPTPTRTPVPNTPPPTLTPTVDLI